MKAGAINFKGTPTHLYGVFKDGSVMSFDGENWLDVKPAGLVKRWRDVELEWRREMFDEEMPLC